MRFTPPYPKPHKSKSSFILRFLRGWHSWLHVLFERSYSMKMGQIRQPGMTAYMVNDKDWVRTILSDTHRYPKHELIHRMLEPLLGVSVFTSNGSEWERQRKLVDQAFAQARLKLVFGLMDAAVGDMLKRIDTAANGEAVAIDSEMTYVTADIIYRTIVSEPLHAQKAADIYAAFEEFQGHAQRSMLLMLYRIPSFFARRASLKSAGKIRSIISESIAVRLAESEQHPENQYQDILAGLIDARDPATGDRFTHQEILDQICVLFLAGHETSASALTWALYLISHCQDVQQRMVDEIAREVGDRPFEIGDIKRMPVVGDVFKEALRLYPPVGFFIREASEAQCIRDKNVKAGSPILIAPWLLHRHRDMWDNPHDFDPDRFSTEASRESVKCAYMPFSKGPRVCIGAAYATQEASLILASIVRRYQVLPVPEHEPMPVGRVTIRSENGVKVKFVRR